MPRARTLFLWLLILGALMMPVDYRANTAEAHTHTIYQVMIDAIVGHPHHHAHEVLTPDGHVPLPDVPIQLGLSMPLLATTSLLALGLLVSSLVAGKLPAPHWAHAVSGYRWIPGIELPPPR